MVLNWAKNQCTHWPRCIFVITAFTRNYDIASLIPRNQEADINHRVITSDACSLNHLHTRPLSHSLMHTFVLSLARLHTCALASERERERLHSFSYSFTFSPPVSSLHSPAHSFSISRVYTSSQKYMDIFFRKYNSKFNHA